MRECGSTGCPPVWSRTSKVRAPSARLTDTSARERRGRVDHGLQGGVDCRECGHCNVTADEPGVDLQVCTEGGREFGRGDGFLEGGQETLFDQCRGKHAMGDGPELSQGVQQ